MSDRHYLANEVGRMRGKSVGSDFEIGTSCSDFVVQESEEEEEDEEGPSPAVSFPVKLF